MEWQNWDLLSSPPPYQMTGESTRRCWLWLPVLQTGLLGDRLYSPAPRHETELAFLPRQLQGALSPVPPFPCASQPGLYLEEQLLSAECCSMCLIGASALADACSQGCVILTVLSFQNVCDLMQLPCGSWNTSIKTDRNKTQLDPIFFS